MEIKPRVLISIATDNVGGPGKGLLQFLRCGGSRLCEPLVSSFWMGAPGKWQFRDEIEKCGVRFEVLRQRTTYDPSLVAQAYSLIKQNKISIIQSHGYKSNLLCLALKKLTRLPWIAFAHGWTAENSRMKFYSRLDGCILKFADRVVTVSDALHQQLRKRGIAGHKIETISNSIDPEEFQSPEENARGLLHVSSDSPLVGVVGRLSPEKGHKFFIDAFKLVRKRLPNARAVLVGEGQEKENLKKLTQELGLEEEIIFAGHRCNMSPFYRGFDVVVLPSLSEGMPNVALEAMLFEKPVVATAVGGVREVVVDGVTGKIVPPANHKELAAAVIALLSDSKLGHDYGKKGRQRVMSEFDPVRRVDKIIQLYKDVLSERRSSRVITCLGDKIGDPDRGHSENANRMG